MKYISSNRKEADVVDRLEDLLNKGSNASDEELKELLDSNWLTWREKKDIKDMLDYRKDMLDDRIRAHKDEQSRQEWNRGLNPFASLKL